MRQGQHHLQQAAGDRRMNSILVGFCTDKSDWISTVIRWLTWWRHSHVVLISPCQLYVIESTHGKGVVGGTLAEFLGRDGVEVRTIPHADPDAVWHKVENEIGKPYDWKYIYGWLFRRNWQDPAAWSCPELIATMAGLFPLDFAGHISPRDLYLISYPLTDSDTIGQRGTL